MDRTTDLEGLRPRPQSWVRRQRQTPSRILVGTAVAYFVASVCSAIVNDHTTVGAVTRPAAGIAVAAALLVPRRRVGWVLGGLALGQCAFGFVRLSAPTVVFAAVLVVCVEALVAGWAVRRLGAPDGELVPTRKFVAFLLGGVLCAPLVAATPGLIALELAGADVASRVPHLLLSDMLGILIFAPVLLAPPARRHHGLLRWAMLYGSVLAAALAVFLLLGRGWGVTLPYVLLPLLAWAGFSFGARAVALCGAIVLVVGNLSIIAGASPFHVIVGSDFERTVALRAFLAVAVASALFLAAVVDDLVDSRALQSALRRAALTDPLTGLPNRLRLEQVLERGGEGPATLLLCDIDDFKRVNDGYGHHVGDALLVEVADRLRGCVRDGDVLARLGGDEFVVVVHVEDQQLADELARRMVDAVAAPFSVGERVALAPSISIGVADTSRSAFDGLLRHADAALYASKEERGSSFRRFDGQLEQRLELRTFVEAHVGAALHSDQLVCEFQPELMAGGDGLFAVEALVRWNHPSRGRIAPSDFVDTVEKIGLADELFRVVLADSLAWQAQWRRERGVLVPVSVNLSPLQLGNTELVSTICGIVEAAEAEPSAVAFEVTEGLVLEPDDATGPLRELAALGFLLAIDDFGTGWASMARLAEYDWDLLKVDRSFVGQLGVSAQADAIVESAIALAHSMGIRVVGEGVETEAQAARLAELGCDIVQGYLYSPALTGEDFGAGLGTDGIWRPASAPVVGPGGAA